jgi:acetylglutamate kinase
VDGLTVDLGCVGVPTAAADPTLLTTLLDAGFVPVVASIGVTAEGRLLNVNADTFAGRVAERLEARRLVVAGTTAGVLDDRGATVAALEPADIERLIGSGTATAGMIAKLRACEQALAGGVRDVVIVDGREAAALEAAALERAPASATRIMQGLGIRN